MHITVKITHFLKVHPAHDNVNDFVQHMYVQYSKLHIHELPKQSYTAKIIIDV